MAKTPNRMPHANPSPDEMQGRLEALQKVDPRLGQYGIQKDVAVEVFNAQRRGRSAEVTDESMAAALPLASSRGEFAKSGLFAEAKALFTDDDSAYDFGYDVTSGEYYDPTLYTNYARIARTRTDGSAPITVRPTSTINPNRPRTVAAGYDQDRKVLTVVFRDGTFYNYYDVSKRMWDSFKAQESKGRYIKRWLDAKPRGEADMTSMSAQAQETMYRVSRTNQLLYEGNQASRPLRQPSLERRLKQSTTTPRASKTTGKNPSKGGKPPKRK